MVYDDELILRCEIHIRTDVGKHRRQPACKGVAGAGGIGRRRCCAPTFHLIRFQDRCIPVHETDGVVDDLLIQRVDVEVREYLRARQIPSEKTVTSSNRRIRCGGRVPVLNKLFFEHFVVPVEKAHRVIDLPRELRRDDHIRKDIVKGYIPAGEIEAFAVGNRRSCRRAALKDILGFEHRSIVVFEQHLIGADGAILCGDCEVCCNIIEGHVPAGKDVSGARWIGGSYCRFMLDNSFGL